MISKLATAGHWRGGLAFGALALLVGGALGLAVGRISPVLLLGGVFSLALVVAIFARPNLGLGLVVFLTYTRFSDVLVHEHGAPSLAQPLSALLIAVVLFRWARYSEQPTGLGTPALLVGLFGLISFTSLIYASDTLRAEELLLNYIKDAIITLIVVMLCTRVRSVYVAIWGLIIAGLFMGMITSYQYLTGTFSNNYWGFGLASVENIVGGVNDFRIAGPIGDPNFYSQLLVVVVPLALDQLIAARQRILRLLAGWALGVCVLSILVTFSRGGFLSLVIVGLFWAIRRPLNPLAMLLCLALGLGLLPLIPERYTDRIATLVDFLPSAGGQAAEDVSFRGRISENLTAIRIFADHPVLGVGRGNYEVHYFDYALQAGIPVGSTGAAHNLYLEILAETGLVGLLAFGLLVVFMFRSVWQAYGAFKRAGRLSDARLVEAFAFGLLGYLASSMFLHGAYFRSFWLLAGVALALPSVVRNEFANVGERHTHES